MYKSQGATSATPNIVSLHGRIQVERHAVRAIHRAIHEKRVHAGQFLLTPVAFLNRDRLDRLLGFHHLLRVIRVHLR